MAHFDVLRNLPHAATISRRIEARVAALKIADEDEAATVFECVAELREVLSSYEDGNDPPETEADQAAHEAAEVGRRLVDAIEALGVGEDRLGQNVRNLFECLGLGQEGAEISLRAGEDPRSLMRPV
jgi:hypothetical protein